MNAIWLINTSTNSLEDRPHGGLHYASLSALARLIGAKVVVETGVEKGFSTMVFLEATAPDGMVHSVDISPEVGDAIPEELKDRWKLHVGDSVLVLPALLKRLGKIDLFFHDSLHTRLHQLLEYEIAWRHLRRGGLLVSDDVGTGAFCHLC